MLSLAFKEAYLELVNFFKAPAAAPVIREKGMEPA